jgi:putative membrane protein
VDAGARKVAQGTADTAEGLATLQPVAAESANASEQVALALNQLAAACPPTAGAYCDGSAAIVPVASAAATSSAGVARGVGTVSSGATEVADGATALASATGALARGVESAETGSADLADGSAATADAAGEVSTGARALADSSEQLASGAADLSGAIGDLVAATAALTTGADQAAAGAADVSAGARSVGEGAEGLTEPTRQLAASLSDTADAVPTYTDDQIDQLSPVVAAPVGTTSDMLYPREDPRASVVPLAVLIALLLLAASVFAVRAPLPRWALRSGGATRRIILTGLRPGLVAVGLLAAGTLVLPLLGIPIARPGSLALLTAAGGITLLALYQAVYALTPRGAPAVATSFLLVQLAAVPWVLPIDVAPVWIQSLNQVLPVPAFLAGVNGAVLGGNQSSVSLTMVVLVGWATAGVLLTTFAIARSYRRVGAVVATT